MEKPPVFTLDLYADQSLATDIVRGKYGPVGPFYSRSTKDEHCLDFIIIRRIFYRRLTVLESIGILSTIFFHRIFPPIKPTTRDLLDLTLVCSLKLFKREYYRNADTTRFSSSPMSMTLNSLLRSKRRPRHWYVLLRIRVQGVAVDKLQVHITGPTCWAREPEHWNHVCWFSHICSSILWTADSSKKD